MEAKEAISEFGHRKVVVTGAGSGIGLTTAQRLADSGAQLVLLDRDRSALGTVTGLEGRPRIVCDVALADDVSAAADQARSELGGVHGLVTAAGVLVRDSSSELSAMAGSGNQRHAYKRVPSKASDASVGWVGQASLGVA